MYAPGAGPADSRFLEIGCGCPACIEPFAKLFAWIAQGQHPDSAEWTAMTAGGRDSLRGEEPPHTTHRDRQAFALTLGTTPLRQVHRVVRGRWTDWYGWAHLATRAAAAEYPFPPPPVPDAPPDEDLGDPVRLLVSGFERQLKVVEARMYAFLRRWERIEPMVTYPGDPRDLFWHWEAREPSANASVLVAACALSNGHQLANPETFGGHADAARAKAAEIRSALRARAGWDVWDGWVHDGD